MTGLDLVRDALIEVAVLCTDAELNVLDEGIDVIIKPSQAALDQMNEVVIEMHTASGLLNDLAGGIELNEAAIAVFDYVRRFAPEPNKSPLAGNSVGTDRTFLARDMPALEAHLHYRNVDVSSLKELVRRWYPRTFFLSPEKHGHHRALGDIQDSINELRFYRETVFRPQPGLSKEDVRHIANKYAPPFNVASPVAPQIS